ncbi:MAG: periplasmic heavy metal sensor [Burkholderiaceae bacterium]|nr:periplasmic heavy metal sensor [Burkholderiaceae bacterium]
MAAPGGHAGDGRDGGGPRMGADAPPPGMEGGLRGMEAGRMGPGHGGPGMPGRGAHGGAEGMPGPHGPQRLGPPPFLHGLDLTEAQQDKVFAILHSQAPYVREQDKALHKARETLHALASAAPYDDAKAAAQAQVVAQAMANLELARVRTEQKLLAVLTAEQRKQVEQRLATMPQRGPRS